jgi:hypothetical protein
VLAGLVGFADNSSSIGGKPSVSDSLIVRRSIGRFETMPGRGRGYSGDLPTVFIRELTRSAELGASRVGAITVGFLT